MNGPTDDLPEAIKRMAEIILYEIENAGSPIFALKGGAKADGFVLGITCCNGLSAESCELLSNHFDSTVEKKLRSLNLGL
ncbi:hypothetical protein RCO22_11030 [Pseudomonas yamanorum]|uniref:Uncharacterized protein n=1 Tax=Pseudomonas yamanorum TaxID=515393 RepID=A0ABU1CQH4_9PSED|nr:hypothetical protein [Pseudomonas yamanorum]MDR0189471.1 hypothetical protein [Pseudomonas yamanorum]